MYQYFILKTNDKSQPVRYHKPILAVPLQKALSKIYWHQKKVSKIGLSYLQLIDYAFEVTYSVHIFCELEHYLN